MDSNAINPLSPGIKSELSGNKIFDQESPHTSHQSPFSSASNPSYFKWKEGIVVYKKEQLKLCIPPKKKIILQFNFLLNEIFVKYYIGPQAQASPKDRV